MQGSLKGGARRRPGVSAPSPWWEEKAFFSPSLPLSTAGWICLLAGERERPPGRRVEEESGEGKTRVHSTGPGRLRDLGRRQISWSWDGIYDLWDTGGTTQVRDGVPRVTRMKGDPRCGEQPV